MDESPQPYLRTPDIDPDGRRVAFVYAGDIWLADAAGGTAERLTAYRAYHEAPRFSPDGTGLAFTSGRSGSGEIYVLPLDSGSLRQLTFHDTQSHVEDWAADGQAIFFSSYREQQGSAIYRVGLDAGTPALIYAEPEEQLGQARVSPDGTLLVFSNIRERWWRHGQNPFAPGEIWLGPAPGGDRIWESAAAYGALRQLVGPGPVGEYGPGSTPYAGRNSWPLWAPDGRGIYFVSDRDGAENLWYLPLEGGEPRQITRFADGRLLFPSIARRAGLIVFERDFRLWLLDPASGEVGPIEVRVRADAKFTPVTATVESYTRFSELSLSPDGKKVAIVARGDVFADFADKETDRDLRQGPAFRVTDTPARESEICWTPDSRSLIYVSDRHGEDELFRYDFITQTETRLTSDLRPKRLPRVSPDGAWVAYLSGEGSLRLLSLNGAAPRELCPVHFIDAADLAWSPDSRWLAFLDQDRAGFSNVWVVSAAAGPARQITFLSNIGGSNLCWAPNGRFLVFTTMHYRTEAQIARVDLRPPEPLFREAEFEKLFEKRPAGEQGSGDRAGPADPAQPPAEPLPVAEAGQTPTDASPPTRDERAAPGEEPGPSPAAPTVEPARGPVVEIVFEGIERRLRFLTPPQMNARSDAISPDSKDLLFRAAVADKVNIWSMPLDEPRAGQPPRQLTASESAKHSLQFTADGRAFFYLEDGQITSRKFPAGDGMVRLQARADVSVDFHHEKLQIFQEAWRALRDSFFDPTFRGQDWAALRARFAPLAVGAQTSRDLHTVINLLVGELRASHLGCFTGGWSGGDGYTGLLFDQDALLRHGWLRVERVLPESPAALADDPPRPGEYLRAVNGVPLRPGVSLDQLLWRAVDRRVRLTLAAAPDGGATRVVSLRPVDADQYAALRYRDWVEGNKRYVARVSNGRLGYVHIPEMSYEAYQRFLVDLDTAIHGMDGVILDVRYNGGGHTATFILDVLTRRSTLRSGFRDRTAMDAGHGHGNRVLSRPTVLVTNERSASNTEAFSESYRRLGLGTIVGRPTAGAVIGTYPIRLLDGAMLRLPSFYVVTVDGEDLEGRGRPVDVEVARPLGEWALGRDRQLDAAVQVLLATSRGESQEALPPHQ